MSSSLAHPQVRALGYSEAAMFLKGAAPEQIVAVVTIAGPREFAIESPVGHQLHLGFSDVAAVTFGDEVAAYRERWRMKKAAENGMEFVPPTLDDAKAIVEFARLLAGHRGLVICQCQAGMSRSPAVAALCLAAWTGPGNEEYCADYLFRVCPAAMPHRDLIRFGDEVMLRRGRLTKAIDSRIM